MNVWICRKSCCSKKLSLLYNEVENCYTLKQYSRRDTTEFVNPKEHARYQLNFQNLTSSLSKHHLIVRSHTLIQCKVLIKVTKSLNYQYIVHIQAILQKIQLHENHSYLCNTLMHGTATNTAKSGAFWKVLKKLKASGFHTHVLHISSEVLLNYSKKTNKMASLPVIPCFQTSLKTSRIY